MSKKFRSCLRKDLLIKVEQNQDNLKKIYYLQEPNSKETFEFGEEEFFLCQSLDGESTVENIIANFELNFGVAISEDNFNLFLQQITEYGLLETPQISTEIQVNAQELPQEDEGDDDEDDFVGGSKKDDVPRWSILKNPDPLFTKIVSFLKPLLILYKLLLWSLIPLCAICFKLWLNEQQLVEESLQIGKQLGSFLTFFLLSLLLINFVTKFGRGLIATYYGGKVSDFGMLIRWGFVPRFYAKLLDINKLSKKQQLFIYGSPLCFRSLLFIIGTFTWYFNLGKGNILSSCGILFAIIGLASLIQGSLPLRPASPGARILSLLMNKSANYPRQLMRRSLGTLFSKQSKKSLSKKEWLIVIFGLIITIILCFIVVKISLRFASGLSRSFPDIFGRGTFYIILVVLLLLGFNYIRKVFFNISRSKLNNNKKKENNPILNEESLEIKDFNNEKNINNFSVKTKRVRLIFFLLLIFSLLMIPMPYSIGGDCQILPPKQQEIQTPISGKIDQVFYQGGDGVLIKKGTMIADIISSDLENQILTLKEQLKEKEAQKKQSLVTLKKLEEGARKEEIEISTKQVEVVRQEVNVALSAVEVVRQEVEEVRAELSVKKEELKSLEQQLESAIITAKYSEQEVTRLESLYEEGAFPLQRLENSQEKADTDKINVVEKRQNLNTQQRIIQQIEAKLASQRQHLEQVKQDVLTKRKSLQEAQAKLNLVLIGTIPADIEVAQQEVKRTTAELNRLQQELKYTQEKNFSSDLLMPFDGYLVESYLDKNIGSYLNQGETFATAQDATNLVAELKIPEYDVGEFSLNVSAQVKLLAYPNQPISGKVIAIEPATQEEDNQLLVRVFTVQIKLENTDFILKPGMSGYGKIKQEKKPTIVILTRPLIRFLQIEFWSWLP